MGLFGTSKPAQPEPEKKPPQGAQPAPKPPADAAPGKPAEDKASEREKMIRVAAVFLANPQIEKESLELKTAFLRRKGLDEAAIKQAFEQYKEKVRMQQEEKELKEELDSLKSDSKSEKGLASRLKRAEKSGFLSLKDFGLTELPPDLFKLLNLHTLILSNNPLHTLPPDLGRLHALRTLHLAACDLADDSLPPELAQLPNLEELDLSANQFTSFDRLTGLKSLKRLVLRANDVLAMPANVARRDQIAELSNLQLLNLSKNNISDISNSVGPLAKIKLLVASVEQNLSGNPIDEEQLEKLKERQKLEQGLAAATSPSGN